MPLDTAAEAPLTAASSGVWVPENLSAGCWTELINVVELLPSVLFHSDTLFQDAHTITVFWVIHIVSDGSVLALVCTFSLTDFLGYALLIAF